ncbi:hypothetical protein PACTADRAFT_64834 [Pachysolen tannophilus NRRL Y-2460]|uniref:Zn(2)-C6 fungal-type domain-containing protein n=1 Tax=Pachysolen tannophilus NRRL Y-2460 TaxID=669874 RepID=A0A1E4U3Z9_PACTA|nr:hypothetical protein PACTADRAFT_64834 [Pachysolen tannophilus NRRL Y-2460]
MRNDARNVVHESDSVRDATNRDNARQRRTRNRIPVACSVCRKRKVKCDKGRPQCDVCRKYNVSHLCFYEEPTWSNNVVSKKSEESEVPKKKNKGVSPKGVTDESPESGLSSFADAATRPIAIIPPTQSSSNQSGYSSPSSQSKSIAFEDHIRTFKSYGNINPPQSSERSTACIPTSSVPIALNPVAQFSANRNLPSIQEQLFSNKSSSTMTQDPEIHSELERMKQKIKEIEASITLSKTFQSNVNTELELNQSVRNPPESEESEESLITSKTAPTFASKVSPMPNDLTDIHSTSDINQEIKCANIVFSSSDMIFSINPNDRIDFYSGYSPLLNKEPTTLNHGPLSFFTFTKKDKYIRIIWRKMIEYKKKRNVFPNDIMSRKPPDDDGYNKDIRSALNKTSYKLDRDIKYEREFKQKFLENEGLLDIQRYEKGSIKSPIMRGKEPTPLSLSLNGQEIELRLIHDIERCLPPKKALWLLLDRFFKFFYPFAPYIDQETFTSEISKIVGERSEEDSATKSITIEKRLDFANVGMMLLFLRLGFLTLFSNQEGASENGEKKGDISDYLLKNSVGVEVSAISQRCLNQFRLLRKTSLSIVQFAIYMRLYHKFAPEEGDGADGGDSMTFTGMLVQMAISIGLNRDPELCDLGSSDSEKIKNIRRKIWYGIVHYDVAQGYVLGNPPTIRLEHYDTRLPVYKGELNTNTPDLGLEQSIIDGYAESNEFDTKMREITDLVINMRNPPKVSDMVEQLLSLESFVSLNFGPLSKLLTPNVGNHVENVTKLRRLLNYLDMVMAIHGLYFHLFLYFEEKSDFTNARVCLLKSLNIMVESTSEFFSLLINSQIYFGEGFDLILTPTMELLVHKILLFHISLLMRCSCLKRSYTVKYISSEINTKVSSLCHHIEHSIERCISGVYKISDRYFYAWRLTKVQCFILELFKKFAANLLDNDKAISAEAKTSVFNKGDYPNQNVFENFSVEDFQEILSMIDSKQYTKQMKQNKYSNISKNSSINTSSAYGNFFGVPNMMFNPEVDNAWYEMMSNNFPTSTNINNVNNDDIFICGADGKKRRKLEGTNKEDNNSKVSGDLFERNLSPSRNAKNADVSDYDYIFDADDPFFHMFGDSLIGDANWNLSNAFT